MATRIVPVLSVRTTAAALAVAVVLAVVGATGAYALWSAQRSVPGGVITTGSAGLVVSGATAMSAAQLYPGQSSTGELTVTNTGTVALGLRVDAVTSSAATGSPSQALTNALTMRLWPKTGTGCTTPPATPAWTGRVGSPGGDLGLVLPAGGSQPLCLGLTLEATAASTAQGATTSLALLLGGVQR